MKNLLKSGFYLFAVLMIITSCTPECDDPTANNTGEKGECEYAPATNSPNGGACDNITCLNGGTCDNGSCDCPAGYSGADCSIFDPCHNINCLNGGTCANGLCNCPTGYTGSDCGTEMTPAKMKITSISVTNYPIIPI